MTATSTPVDRAPAAAAATRNFAWRGQARALIDDLFERSPAIYWTDFLLSTGVGWALTAVYFLATPWSAVQIAAFLVASLLFFRSGTFIHEIIHMPNQQMVWFKRAWNLLLGIPFLMPWIMYSNHIEHHNHRRFGTPSDGEYLPLGSSPVKETLKYLAQAPLLPLFMLVRFGVLGPLSWLHGGLRHWVLTRASAAVSNPYYSERFPKRFEKHLKIVEALCFVYIVALAVLVWRDVISFTHVAMGYLLLAFTLGLNWVRNLAAHRYVNDGTPMDLAGQVEESINITGQTWLTIAFFPVGLRYHALHHLFPALPYHNMDEAHRRLMQNLPADASYRITNRDSFFAAVRRALAVGPSDAARAIGDARVAAAVRPILNAGVPGLMPVFEALDALATASPPPCLIVNPLSFRASRGLAEQAQAVAKAQGAEVAVVDGPESLTAAVEAILARRQRHVMVLAGDGTVRAVIDQLACLPAGAWVPDLLVLPGGRTNLTAADLTPGVDALALLERGLAAVAEKRWDAAIVERATLCIEQGPSSARHGLWVGMALIDGVIRRTHAHRTGGDGGALRTGHLSTVSSLLRLVVLALRGRSGLSCPDLHIDAGPLGRFEGKVNLLLATTLQHRQGLFDPYATRADGGMRLTAVSRHATRFYRSLPRLLTGRFSRSMNVAHGFLSGGCELVEITGLAGYSLDGEAYDTDPARPVVIRRGPSLRFFAA